MRRMDWGNPDDERIPRTEFNNRNDIRWSQIETGYKFRDFFVNRRAEGLKYALSEAGQNFWLIFKAWAIEISELYGLMENPYKIHEPLQAIEGERSWKIKGGEW